MQITTGLRGVWLDLEGFKA